MNICFGFSSDVRTDETVETISCALERSLTRLAFQYRFGKKVWSMYSSTTKKNKNNIRFVEREEKNEQH